MDTPAKKRPKTGHMINAEDRAKAIKKRKEELTHRQLKIVRDYFECWNKTEAYRSAYRDGKCDKADIKAAIFFRNPRIIAYIKKIVGEVDMVAYVKQGLFRLSKIASHTDQLKAYQLLGQTKAMFIEKQEIVKAPIPIQVIMMSPDEEKRLVDEKNGEEPKKIIDVEVMPEKEEDKDVASNSTG